MTIKRKDLFEEGCNKLIEQRENYKEMRALAKAASDEFQIDLPIIMAVKDYDHYKKADWENNPLESNQDADYKDKLMQPFRQMFKAIENLRATGNLEMLDPMIKVLEENGVHLSIDDTVKFSRNIELMTYIKSMSSYQGSICELADERKDLGKVSKDLKDSTSRSYTQYISTYASYKAAKEKGKDTSKLEEKLHNLILDSGIDSNVYMTLNDDITNL